MFRCHVSFAEGMCKKQTCIKKSTTLHLKYIWIRCILWFGIPIIRHHFGTRKLEVGATNATLLNQFDQEPWRWSEGRRRNFGSKGGGTPKTGWWQLKYVFYVHPENWGKMNPIWRAYFSEGLKPPTRKPFPKNQGNYAHGKGDWSELESSAKDRIGTRTKSYATREAFWSLRDL